MTHPIKKILRIIDPNFIILDTSYDRVKNRKTLIIHAKLSAEHTPFKSALPEVLMVHEFSSHTSSKDKMCFICADVKLVN